MELQLKQSLTRPHQLAQFRQYNLLYGAQGMRYERIRTYPQPH
jgi:hypothetical protein